MPVYRACQKLLIRQLPVREANAKKHLGCSNANTSLGRWRSGSIYGELVKKRGHYVALRAHGLRATQLVMDQF